MFNGILTFLGPNSADEFVPVDPAQLATVSAKSLMVGAYGALFALLVIYSVSLLWRERKITRSLDELEKLK